MIKILIVDDEAMTRALHREYIERLDGFTVIGEASGARAAIAAVRQEPRPDLVLLDMTMPGGHGIEVAKHVKMEYPSIDLIAVTGVRQAEVVRAAVALGVAHYLIKPFTFATFRERLSSYREFRERANEVAQVATQHEVDAILGALRTPTAVTLPKGLAPESLERVTLALRTHQRLSAAEAAEELSMSRVAARRYLEHLVASGVAERDQRYGAPGRPVSEYRMRLP